ncbi:MULTISPECIES: hypothetical protein [unclassified Microcoleus]
MGNWAWGMGHGAWGMGHGAWGMGHGAWVIVGCQMASRETALPCPVRGRR